MIALRYAITKEDYVNYYTYVMWDSPENKKKRRSYYVKQVLPLVIFILAFYYTGIFERSSKFILLIMGFIFLTSMLSLFGVRSNSVRQAEKIADEPDNNSIFLESNVLISEAGIVVKDELKEIKYSWMSFTKKLESKNYYFLFNNTIQAVIIPKRVFTSQGQFTEFEKLLAQFLSFDAEIGHLIKT